MKHANVIPDVIKGWMKRIRFVLTMTALVLLALCNNVGHAQTAIHDKSLKSYKIPPNLKKHIVDKHKRNNDNIDDVTSNLHETPHGPRGRLTFGGHISSYAAKAGSGDPATRARAIAKAFLKDEAELLGMPDIGELRERRFVTNMGHGGEHTHIYYTRYIGDLPLEHSDVHLRLGPDEAIAFVDLSLVPVPSELYRAVANKTISEDEARLIITTDVRTKNANIKEFKTGIEIFAIPSMPYAIWKGGVSLGGGKIWKYEVNAFTGEIINIQKLLIGDRE